MKTYKNILVYMPNWLGDVIMAYPVIDNLKKCFPESSVSVMGKAVMMSIFEDNPIIDKIIDVKNYKSINKKDFDAIILTPNSFISGFQAWRTGIKNRFGSNTDSRGIFLTKKIDVKYPEYLKLHTTDRYITIVNKSFGVDIEIPPQLLLPIGKQLKQNAKEYLESLGIFGEKIFAYGIGATNGLGKIWSEKHYAELANTNHKKHKAHTLFVATPNDKDTIARIKEHMDHEPFITNTTLGTIAGILSYCSGFVGNDSGAMHLSSAVGVPTVGLYFATPAYKNYPRGENVRYIEKHSPCEMCSGIKCTYKNESYECRTLITPDEVFEMLSNILTKIENS